MSGVLVGEITGYDTIEALDEGIKTLQGLVGTAKTPEWVESNKRLLCV